MSGKAAGWGDSPTHWAVVNGVEPQRFDVIGGGYRAGQCRLAAKPACAPLLEGVDFRGHNLVSPQLGVRPDGTSVGRTVEWPPVEAGSPRDCCAACGMAWPYCRAWTFARPAGGGAGGVCSLKSSDQGRVAVGGSAVVSGHMVQACAAPSEQRTPPSDPAAPPSSPKAGVIEDVAEAPGWPEHRSGEGYIYCLASGGLADALNQLWRCADLARRRGFARVFFDMPKYAATRLSDVFDVSRFPVPLSLGHGVGHHIDALFAAGTLMAMAAVPRSALASYGKHEAPYLSRPPPFSRSTLLVFQLSSGDCMAGAVLQHLSLSPPMRAAWLSLRARFPAKYASVHVRNTDLRAPARAVHKFIAAVPRTHPIVLVTDDADLAAAVASERKDVLIAPTRRESTSKSLHLMGARQDYILPEAILDLLLIASGQELWLKRGLDTLAQPTRAGAGVSGYSLLAEDLHHCDAVRRSFIHGASTLQAAARPCSAKARSCVAELVAAWPRL